MEAVLVNSHADSSATGLVGAVSARAGDFSIVIDLVEFQDSQLNGLVDSLDLLGLGVGLLLSLLTTTAQTEHQVESGLLLDVVVREGAAVLQLLAGKDQTLLVRWDALLVLNLLLDIVNGVGGLHIKSDGLARERLHENL